MTEIPPPLSYQGIDPNASDRSYLNVLSILHYVLGGLTLLFSCIGIIYIVIGLFLAMGSFPDQQGPTTDPVTMANIKASQQTSQRAAGFTLAACGTGGVLLGWALGFVTIVSGRRIAQRRSRVFSIVIAGISCASFPFGTALGVFTIIMLSKETVKAMYADAQARIA